MQKILLWIFFLIVSEPCSLLSPTSSGSECGSNCYLRRWHVQETDDGRLLYYKDFHEFIIMKNKPEGKDDKASEILSRKVVAVIRKHVNQSLLNMSLSLTTQILLTYGQNLIPWFKKCLETKLFLFDGW